MKIKINQYEKYNINLPDEVGTEELSVIIDRLKTILNMSIKMDPFAQIQTPKERPRKYQWGTGIIALALTREVIVRIIQIHYHGNQDLRDQLCDIFQRDYADIAKTYTNLKNQHTIIPYEVGLREYPIKSDENITISDLRLPDFEFNEDITDIIDEIKTKQSSNPYKTPSIGIIGFGFSRETSIKILEVFYHGTKEQKEELAKIFDKDVIQMSKNFPKLKFKHNIRPNEVGLIHYPSPGGYLDRDKIPKITLEDYEFNVDLELLLNEIKKKKEEKTASSESRILPE